MRAGPSRGSLQGRGRGAGAAAWLAVGILALAGCASNPKDIHDPAVSKGREDFKTLGRAPRPEPEPSPARPEPAVPELAPMAPEPQGPTLTPNPRVSISATEEVELKDILFQLARQAGVEIEIDPRIAGGIVLSVRNRPFLEVIERVSRLAGLRYSVEDNVVRVAVDTPRQRNYSISYITQARQTASRIAISTELNTPGAANAGGGSGADTSSSSVVTSSASADVYAGLERALQMIVRNTAPRGLLQDGGADDGRVFVLPQAGLVSVFGTSRQQKAVQDYLNRVREAIAAQVLIEAKVIEVDLNREFNSGVNWRAVLGDLNTAARFGGQVAVPPFDALTDAASGVLSFGAQTEDFGALLNLVESFGTTRTLSSPRMTVMNNQTAILKVAENEVFFELDVEREVDDDTDSDEINDILSIDSEIRTLPIGLVMAVQPAIDLEDHRVTLTLRPTITRIQGFASDPAVAILSDNQVESRIPIVETRELDSVLELDSGEIAVLGGLMQERAQNADDGVPGLARIPLLGRAFKAREETTDLVELVVLLRATVLDRAGRAVSPADRRLYRDFTRDPRPFPLPPVNGS